MARGRQIAATFLVAAGLFGLLSLYSSATGEVGRYLSAFLRDLMGQAAGGPMLILIWLGVILFRRPWDLVTARRLTGILLVLPVIAAGLHLYRLWPAWPPAWIVAEQVSAGSRLGGGGALGGAIAAVLMNGLGPLGTALAGLALMLVAWLLVAERSWRTALAGVGREAFGPQGRLPRPNLPRSLPPPPPRAPPPP
ncbi:MAG: DNA translocase FtsK 4TM domain-containing protein, partial [Firmicutes bacterium]|nr:DNA translocase FtsK 4TM domain-containing protein [Bacillota bacterium]